MTPHSPSSTPFPQTHTHLNDTKSSFGITHLMGLIFHYIRESFHFNGEQYFIEMDHFCYLILGRPYRITTPSQCHSPIPIPIFILCKSFLPFVSFGIISLKDLPSILTGTENTKGIYCPAFGAVVLQLFFCNL